MKVKEPTVVDKHDMKTMLLLIDSLKENVIDEDHLYVINRFINDKDFSKLVINNLDMIKE